MTKHLEKFTSFEDAAMWIQQHVCDVRLKDKRLVECRIIYMEQGGFWSAGIAYAG